MDKKVKWGIVILVGAGLIGWGIYSRLPKANEELAAADKVMTGKQINKRVLNVNAKIIKPQLLTDQIQISGSLMPDEEVDLSFETSGKIVEINFDEGTTVKKGQLLAKVNDRQLQAQLQRLVAQLKLAEDRVFRQNALLERDAVSKEAYEQVKTELATLNADIDLVNPTVVLSCCPYPKVIIPSSAFGIANTFTGVINVTIPTSNIAITFLNVFTILKFSSL